ncbi:MAG: 4-hydroxy-tetrahydrodipicolinate synthase [Deltaproteobacteria bacterium]|nr:4-hydroxy-tetrahydrodipicolinate synthase [Deltaproteobacteria bacterium]
MTIPALRGSFPPLVTPLRDGAVDYDGFARLVEWQAAEGSHGVVVCGTTGEPTTLTRAERGELVRVAVAAARGRIPVVAATGSQSHEETVGLTADAERAGADALLIVTPYFIRPPQRGLVAYFTDLARRTAKPLLIYHIPVRAAVNIEVDSVARIVEAAPHVVGLKHAANDLGFVTQLLARLGADFRIFVGLEELSLPMLAVGAAGMMNAVGNVASRQVAALYAAVARGDLAAARAWHDQLFTLNQAVFWDTNPIPIKYLMKRLGLLAENAHRLPMLPATTELAARLDRLLEQPPLRQPGA